MSQTSQKSITITVDGKPVQVSEGLLISALKAVSLPCGGHGRCGKCKVIAVGELSPVTNEERQMLTTDELSRGVRLACKTRVMGECEIRTVKSRLESVVLQGEEVKISLSPTFEGYGIAVDVGTTTVAGRLYDAKGRMLSEAGEMNAQGVLGADVISRIEWALKGEAERLRSLITSQVDGLIVRLCSLAGVSAGQVGGVVITGNTAMLSLFAGVSVYPLSRAPFKPSTLFGYHESAQKLGLSALQPATRVYLPPCISAFVGADAVCAMLAVGLLGQNLAMLVDVGTNGEIALIKDGKISVCSTAVGPAFEGVGISCGMTASEGAIDKVSVVNGLLCARVIGGGKARGVCGSGIIDAVACLLDTEQLDESGFLEEDAVLQDGVSLTQADIRAVQLAKSAVCAGITTLMDRASVNKLDGFFIAGGFGKSLSVASAERIGLIPKGVGEVATTVGNAALTGASMMLLSGSAHESGKSIADGAEAVELAANPVFVERFMMGMTFEETGE